MDHQEVDRSRIEQVAYDFWVQRGCPMGSPRKTGFAPNRSCVAKALDRESPVASIAATSAGAYGPLSFASIICP